MTTEIKLVYVTTSSKEESLTISRVIVEERLAACANIMEKVHSVFNWEDAIQESEESVIIFKTHSNTIDNLIQKIKMLHSYECPCISVVSIESGNTEFFDWISSQTGDLD
tara:strand:- start:612 stop:941 length:330 start_codon:yes stop_codon:yes gene_type:complete